jgi:hypothetical protein
MNRKLLPFLFFGLLLMLFGAFRAEATHLKGGEITVRRTSKTSLTYEFTLTTYTENNPANSSQDSAFFCFGDGRAGFWVRRINGTNRKGEPLPDGSYKNIYRTLYTYQAPATAYKVSVGIKNRNSEVKNVPNSVNTSFYVETVFSINSGLGLNATPVLLNPAIDLTAVVGQKFIHNPNAVDPEGDSLAYRLVICKYKNDEERCTDGQVIPGFVQPNEIFAGQNQAGTGPSHG